MARLSVCDIVGTGLDIFTDPVTTVIEYAPLTLESVQSLGTLV
jgi:hypothetical protein